MCSLADTVEEGKVEFTLLEKETEETLGTLTRGQVLRPEAAKFLTETGLLEYLKKKNPVLKSKPEEDLLHRARGHLGSFSYDILAPGYPMIYLPHPLIVESLHERMRELGVRVIYGAEAKACIRQGDQIGVSYQPKAQFHRNSPEGRTAQKTFGDLLIAADGATSPVRSSLGINVDFYDYKSGYLVIVLDRFAGFSNDRFCMSEHGFVPFFSLPDGKIRAMVEISIENLREWMQLSKDQIHRRLTTWWLPELSASNVKEVGSFYHVIRRHAKTYIGERAALIGDAAHTTHPMLGQGMSMVFSDISILSKIIRADPSSASDPEKLKKYETQARAFASSVLENSHNLHSAVLEAGKDPSILKQHEELLARCGFHASPGFAALHS